MNLEIYFLHILCTTISYAFMFVEAGAYNELAIAFGFVVPFGFVAFSCVSLKSSGVKRTCLPLKNDFSFQTVGTHWGLSPLGCFHFLVKVYE